MEDELQAASAWGVCPQDWQQLSQPRVTNQRMITVDKNPACPQAVRELKRAGPLWGFSRLCQRKCLNNIVEQTIRASKA